MGYLALFALGAAGGLIGDQGHVASGTTTYLDRGVPFVWESAIWFVAMVGFGTVGLGAIRTRLGPARRGGLRDGTVAVAAVIGIYAVTAAVRDVPLGPATALVFSLAAIAAVALGGGRPAAICAVLAVVAGTTVEMVLAALEVFRYADEIDVLAGVAPWLPGLYLAYGVAVARLAELLVMRR